MILKYLNGNKNNFISKLELILDKRKLVQKNKSGTVKPIIKDVRKKGDKALIKYEKRFSKIKTKKTTLQFSNKEIEKIIKKIDSNLIRSIDIAYKRLKNFITYKKFYRLSLKIITKMNFHMFFPQLIKWVYMFQEDQQVIQAQF